MTSQAHTFYWMRHGAVTGRPALYGRSDIELSESGWKQLNKQCEALGRLDHIVSSPLLRCRAFAEMLSQQRRTPLTINEKLRECDFGKWDGIAYEDIPKPSWNALEAFWLAPATNTLEGAEDIQDMYTRVIRAWQQLLDNAQASKEPQTLLIISHGGVIRMVLAYILNIDYQASELYTHWRINYASLTKISLPSYKAATPIIDFVGLPCAWRDEE